MHAPASQLDEEEHIEASEPERLDREEVARDHRLRLRTEELAPAEPSPRSGGRHVGLAQDLGHGRRRHPHAHTRQLTDDPLVAPTRVLTRKTQNELADLLGYPRSAGTAPGVGPPPPNKLAMPTQQRVRADEQRLQTRAPEKPAGRGKEDTVGLRQTRTGDLAAKNRQLVAQYHDLELLELARTHTQRSHRERTPKQQIHQRHEQGQTPSTGCGRGPTLRPRSQLRRVLEQPDGFTYPTRSPATGARGADPRLRRGGGRPVEPVGARRTLTLALNG